MTFRGPLAGNVPLPGEWADSGACRGKPTIWWYPGVVRRGDEVTPVERATAVWAKGICAGCPVRRPCLDHAVRHREIGIWAGTTEAERKDMRRRRRRGVA